MASGCQIWSGLLLLSWYQWLVLHVVYRIAGNFVGLNFRYQVLKAYFRGLIFVVCPEHIIVVAYCPRLLFKCLDFRGEFFVWRLFVTKIKPNEIFPLYGIVACWYTCNNFF